MQLRLKASGRGLERAAKMTRSIKTRKTASHKQLHAHNHSQNRTEAMNLAVTTMSGPAANPHIRTDIALSLSLVAVLVTVI